MTAYGRLAALFWTKISSGEWAAGMRLPTVVELAKLYGVAPATVRGAFGLLAAQGLIHSRQGRGTFVLHRGEGSGGDAGGVLGGSYFDSWIVGPEEAVRVLARNEGSKVPPDLADGAPVFDDYVHLRRLHVGSAAPVCLVDFHIARVAYDSLPPGIDSGFKVGLLLMTKANPRPARGRQVTTVGLASPEDAGLLQIAVGSPIVRVERRFIDDRGWVLGAGVHRYPGSVFRQVIDQPVEEILADINTWLPSRAAKAQQAAEGQHQEQGIKEGSHGTERSDEEA